MESNVGLKNPKLQLLSKKELALCMITGTEGLGHHNTEFPICTNAVVRSFHPLPFELAISRFTNNLTKHLHDDETALQCLSSHGSAP